MASYVLKHAQVAITESGTSYSTTTNLLTVAASHLYIIKGVRCLNELSFGGAATGFHVGLELSDNAGATFRAIVPTTTLTSAGAVSDADIHWDFGVVPAPTTTTPTNFASVFGAVASGEVKFIGIPGIRDLHMEAGQILRFTPNNTAGTATGVGTSNGSTLRFEISYIDYTL